MPFSKDDKKLVIASRGSKLALWQSEHIKARLQALYPDFEISIEVYKTRGDKILDVPLAKVGGKGLFTKELEEAMLRGDAHLAVHSLKDVPTQFEEGFVLAAVTEREDPRDALLSEKYNSLDALPKGAVVGSTSLRRQMQIRNYRPDLKVKNLRGNVQTRIQKLKDGEYDAIILAAAGINRLGIHDAVKHIVPVSKSIMIPAMGQAVLGIECLNDPEILTMLAPLNDERSIVESRIERDFVDELQGGCQVPIGVNAELHDDQSVSITAMIGMPDASELLEERITVNKDTFESVGREFADKFISQGAQEILKRAEAVAFQD